MYKAQIKDQLPSGMTEAVIVNGLKKTFAVPDFPYLWQTANAQPLDKFVVAVSYRKGVASATPSLVYGDTLYQLVSLVRVKESRTCIVGDKKGQEHIAQEVIALLLMPAGFAHTDNVEALIDAAETIYMPKMWESQEKLDFEKYPSLLNLLNTSRKALSGSTHYQEQMQVLSSPQTAQDFILHAGGMIFTDENNKDCDVLDKEAYIGLLKAFVYEKYMHKGVLETMLVSILVVAWQEGLGKLNIRADGGQKIISEAQKQQLQEQVDELKKRHSAVAEQLASAIMRLHDVDSNIPPDVRKEIARRMSGKHMDEGKTSAWLQAALSIPFNKEAKPVIDLNAVMGGMNKTHYGMEKAKDKIVQFIARLKRQQETGESSNEPTILCFVGAPGIGKTTLAKSLANTLGLPSEIISLAGASDAHFLRGHSFTYVGSEMGKIGRALASMGVMNGVLILDEIDKTNKAGRNTSGIDDALLALLDPSQNNSFHDDYLGFGLDVSKCLIICTANYIDQIPEALESRMNIIHLNSYSMPQKAHIGQNYLLPDILKAVKGTDGFSVEIPEKTLESVISRYTFEAGVRKLREKLGDLVNKCLVLFDEDKTNPHFVLDEDKLATLLGKPKIPVNRVPEGAPLRKGVINGLSVRGYVGDVLSFNAMLRPNFAQPEKPALGKLILTGMQKEMMKESFNDSFSVALGLFEKNLSNYKGTPDRLFNKDIHLSTDETATSKDGNSAGGVVTVLLYALFADKEIRSDVAMTGAINLQGHIKAIGGLREKLLGAAEAGVKIALYPVENQADYEDIDPSDLAYIEKCGMEVRAISNIEEALAVFIKQ